MQANREILLLGRRPIVPSGGPDKHPMRSLAIMLTFGVLLWVAALFALLTALSFAHVTADPTVLNFYWVMAACGALFGFERWLYHQQGGVNPFHDR